MIELTQQQTQVKFLTLSELCERIRTVLSDEIGTEWVQAEIVKMNPYPESGHCYFDLVEKENERVRAKIKAVIWKDNFPFINNKFKNVTRENLKEGIKVLLRVRVNYHAEFGLKLNIVDIEPNFTLGDMMMTRRLTIERLHAEDCFNRNKLLSFPLLPKRIAIISTETNAGYRDFLAKLRGRSKYFFGLQLFPSRIDGDAAISEIVDQLTVIRNQIKQFDVVAIIRGGDNAIGFHCYDNYELAKAIALFPIPVVTGIGHSTSDTVVEMVAHLSKITPTDLAVHLIECFETFDKRIDEAKRKIQFYADRKIKKENERLEKSQTLFTSRTKGAIRIFRSELNSKITELKKSFKYKLKDEKELVDRLEKEIKHKSPETILARGYSITFHNDRPVKDASKLKPGAVLRTQVHKGEIISQVKTEKS